MSQDDLDGLRRLYDEWAEGNLWALRDIADPGIEWEWAPEMASLFGGPRIYRGLEEIYAATLEWLTAWEAYWMTADEFLEAADDQIVVVMHIHGRTAAIEAVFEQRVGALWRLRGGKALSVRFFMDPAEALAAAEP
jgi:ketosteroid isomerase-like protein